MLYNYENGIKKLRQEENSIYTFSSLTTYEINIKSTFFDVSIKDVDGEPGIFFSNKSLIQFLKDWQAMKELLASGSQTQDNYEIWKTIRPSVTKVPHE